MNLPEDLGQVELFHTGLVVEKLEKAMTTLASGTGVSWRTIRDYGEIEVWSFDGPARTHLRRAYSCEGPPFLELVEVDQRGPWGEGRLGGAFHLGYWTQDLPGSCQVWEQIGFKRVLCDMSGGDWPASFAYYRTPEGLTLELLPTHRRSDILGD